MLSRGRWLQTLLNYIKEKNVYFIAYQGNKINGDSALHGM